MSTKKLYIRYFGVSLLIILIDQLVKLWTYHNMQLGEEIPILGSWLKLHYTLNPGMAFGMAFGGAWGKLLLTAFRIIAMLAIAYYLFHSIRQRMHPGLRLCVALILGGAIGNLIDSVFYGVWLGNAPHYAPGRWFYGQVVDMFYIDIWEGYLPEWLPLLGGQYMALWPIFNVADASIFIGVAVILIFQKRFFYSPKVDTTLAAKDSLKTTHLADNKEG